MPPTIIAVAISLKASINLPGCHTKKPGKKRLKIRANIPTNIGRLLTIVETSDTGPLCSAKNNNIDATGANVSLKAIKARVESLRSILLS